MILPFSGFFTIMRNALSTRHHQAKNSRLSTLVAKVTFGQLILSQNFQQISDNFFIQFFIYRPRRYHVPFQDRSICVEPGPFCS